MTDLTCTTCKQAITPDDRWCPLCRQPAVLLKRYWLQFEKLGQGGFGVVFEARDLRLPRRCAVKELPRPAGNDQQTRSEVEALALISNIGLPFVPEIYDYDDQDPTHYYIVMEYISGPTLDRLPREFWSPAQVEVFLLRLLEHLQQLHAAGIYHRDIKPQNIKYTNDQRFVLLDFGVSKKTTDDSTQRALTTLYAPLEQLRHEGTDDRTDLFSLGVTAYQLLAGKLPPSAEDRQKGKRLPPPSELTPGISPALEQAILALLALNRDQRPADALAARALLNPQPAVLDPLKDELDKVFAEHEKLDPPTVRPADSTCKPELLRLGKGRILSVAIAAQTHTLAIATPLGTYLYDTHTFEQQWIDSNVPTQPPMFVHNGEGIVIALAQGVRVWNASDGKPQQSLALNLPEDSLFALSDDVQMLAVARADDVSVRQTSENEPPYPLPGVGERAHILAFSPSGALLALAAGRMLHLWRIQDRQMLLTVELDARISAVAFSPDGQVLAAIFGPSLQAWRVSDGRVMFEPRRYDSRITAFAFAPDGQTIATAAGLTISIGRFVRGESTRTLTVSAPVHSLAFAEEGRGLIASSADDVRRWQIADGTLTHTLSDHWNRLHSLAFSSDGSVLAAIGGMVRVWAYTNQGLTEQGSITHHTVNQNTLTFTPDSTVLVCGSSAGITLHRLPDLALVCSIATRPVQAHGVAISPDGGQIVVVAEQLERYDSITGALLHTQSYPGEDVYDVALTPGGALAAVLSQDAAQVIRTHDGEMICVIDTAQFAVTHGYGEAKSLSLSPDGALLAVLFQEHVCIWSISPNELRLTLPGHTQRFVWSPDQHVYALLQDHVIRLYHSNQAHPVRVFEGHRAQVSAAAFTPDGATLASTAHDGTVRLWHV